MKKTIFGLSVAMATSLAWAALPPLLPMPQSVREGKGAWECSADSFDAIPVREVAASDVPAEGYRLKVDEGGVTVERSSPAGAFYARRTLAQLAAKVGKDGKKWSVPFVEIDDAPAFGWRGVHLDEGRHFFGKEVVKRILDLMAGYKLNVFHWHLTEDQGWRIDVPGYPELVKYGAVRSASPKYGTGGKVLNGEKYGPFYYTEADLKEVVAYAAERHIKVVPEIELPGHVLAFLAAYPEFCCNPDAIRKRREPRLTWGIERNVLCVGNDKALKVFDDIFDFVCKVFPSDVIHIGGDECPRKNWKTCPKCIARAKAEGLASTDRLQAWLTKRVADRLAAKGRRIIGWDEMLSSGDVPVEAIGMIWRVDRKRNGADTNFMNLKSVKRGHDIVMAPGPYCYFNKHQDLKGDDPYEYNGGHVPLSAVYGFDPAKGAESPEMRAHILGAQCCNWSEYTCSRFDLEWKMWPRTLAMAEVLWTAPKKRDLGEFVSRAKVHCSRLIQRGVNCAPAQYK